MKIPAVYESGDYFFVWKPNGIPTTFGKKESFVDKLVYLSKNINEKNLDETQRKFFGLVRQLGQDVDKLLLNRLDNDTGGLLYFAKNKEAFDRFKDLQSQNKIEKFYICDVWVKNPNIVLDKLEEKLKQENGYFVIDYPIAHHKYLKEKMVVVKSEKDKTKIRGKLHYVKTLFKPLYVDGNIITFEVIIFRGIRHQIRVHMASVGLSILGDRLYGIQLENQNTDDILHLRSIGLRF